MNFCNDKFLSRFSKTLKMYCKLLRRSVEIPWMRCSLKKFWLENKMGGGKVFIELLGGYRFPKGP